MKKSLVYGLIGFVVGAGIVTAKNKSNSKREDKEANVSWELLDKLLSEIEESILYDELENVLAEDTRIKIKAATLAKLHSEFCNIHEEKLHEIGMDRIKIEPISVPNDLSGGLIGLILHEMKDMYNSYLSRAESGRESQKNLMYANVVALTRNRIINKYGAEIRKVTGGECLTSTLKIK